jgi:hypothetical protein
MNKTTILNKQNFCEMTMNCVQLLLENDSLNSKTVIESIKNEHNEIIDDLEIRFISDEKTENTGILLKITVDETVMIYDSIYENIFTINL